MKLIIISGPSGSGKTTLSSQILKKVKNGFVLRTDNYYRTGFISKLYALFIRNYFDRKISFNKKLFKKDFEFIQNNSESNHEYSYDFAKKTILKIFKKHENIKFLIIEGIFAKEVISNISIKDYFFIELTINKKTCMNRVIKRDIYERGKSRKLAISDFLKSWDLYYLRNKNETSRNNYLNLKYSETKDIDQIIEEIFKLKI